jgi:hypothetical protein
MDPQTREALAELLLTWDDAFRAGHDVAAEELARDRPNLIEPLARRIRVLKATSWIDQPTDAADEAPDPSPAGGRMLGGRYRLDERIAVGGFAEVWKGFDTELQRVVAVKLPKASRIAMREAFLAEARRVARLRHPAVASVHDVGTDGNECYIVSEFMDGGSLADRLTRGPIETSLAVRWVGQIAHALDYAHSQGVTHRDVKPANILLNHHGDAVLADFGIAQSATRSGDFAPSIGTLRYMAPEQLAGSAVGPAADIYSLGIVLHELVTGATPHSSDAPAAIRREVTGAGALALAPSLPAPLAAVCRRAVDRDPNRRHHSAANFAAEIRLADDARTPAAFPRRLAFVGTAALAAVAAGVMLAPRRPPQAPRSAAAPTPTPIRLPVDAAPPLAVQADSRTAAVTFLRIEDSLPYVVEARDIGHYREWQSSPDTYLGCLRNDVECQVVYRFETTVPVAHARLIAVSRCWDFVAEPGGAGRGAAAIDVSRDGGTWIPVRDAIAGPEWGGDWVIDEPLPTAVLGGVAIWVRVRLLTIGSPNITYSVAQFGRNRDDPSQPTFGIIAELTPAE